jgi:hypothetical protein
LSKIFLKVESQLEKEVKGGDRESAAGDAKSYPYGSTMPNVNPSSLGLFGYNFMFRGQHDATAAAGQHHNYHGILTQPQVWSPATVRTAPRVQTFRFISHFRLVPTRANDCDQGRISFAALDV